MKMIWHIIKKDLRAIWPLWLAWMALIAIRIPLLLYYMNSAGVQALSLMNLVGGCSLLADALLVLSLARGLVHEDPLVGGKSLWVTRPITGCQLLVAKFLAAFLVCVISPLALLVPTWFGFGFSPAEIARVLTCHGLLNSILVALAFLFAVITRRASSFWLVLVSAVVAVVILVIASSQWVKIDLGRNERQIAMYLGLVLLLFGVVQQFVRRRVWIAQGCLMGVCVLLGIIFLPHLPSYSSHVDDGERIDQPLTVTWKSLDAYFVKKEPKSSLPDSVRGDLVISVPKEYNRIEMRLLQGQWISPTGRVDEAVRTDTWGNLVEGPFPMVSSTMGKDGPDAFTGRAPLYLSANCLWNLDQPWTYTGFSGRVRIRFIQVATVADLKPITGAKMRMGSFSTRLLSVKSYKGAVKITSIHVASSVSPYERVELLDLSGIKLMQTNGFEHNSPPILWVRLTLHDWFYSALWPEESKGKKAPRLFDKDLMSGGETHENMGELGWHFTTKVDQIVGYNDYDLKADHIEIHKNGLP